VPQPDVAAYSITSSDHAKVSYCGNEPLRALLADDRENDITYSDYAQPVWLRRFDRLISWLPTEDDLVTWCAGFFRHPLTHAQLEQYLESSKQPNARVIFTARTPDGEAVGHIEVSQIWPHLSSRLSRVLVVPDHRHRGIGSMIIREALSFSFAQHCVDHIDLGVSASNFAAIGCYAKLGFAQVGKWSNAIVTGSHTVDVVWMTLARDKWLRRDVGP
jgi:RimJ/RimL family protein N-acetyltransferase